MRENIDGFRRHNRLCRILHAFSDVVTDFPHNRVSLSANRPRRLTRRTNSRRRHLICSGRYCSRALFMFFTPSRKSRKLFVSGSSAVSVSSFSFEMFRLSITLDICLPYSSELSILNVSSGTCLTFDGSSDLSADEACRTLHRRQDFLFSSSCAPLSMFLPITLRYTVA